MTDPLEDEGESTGENRDESGPSYEGRSSVGVGSFRGSGRRVRGTVTGG